MKQVWKKIFHQMKNRLPRDISNVVKDLEPRKFGKVGLIWTIGLAIVFIAGAISYTVQIREGLGITAMRDYASWGIYISNFVFFVAISLVGSLISAILYLSGAKWGAVLNRIAEIIAVSSIFFAAVIVIVDTGRPDRLWHLIVYGRLQSPIIWDVVVVATYMVLSILLLFFPLIEDMHLINKYSVTNNKWLKKVYNFLSFHWVDSPQQKEIIRKSIRILAITIIPVAFAIHTVTSWLFATTYRPGWDSTNFGAYFVSGAFLAGAACVVIAMYVYRRAYHLQNYITKVHFDRMGKLTVLLALLYLYFNVNEYLIPGFKMKSGESGHLTELLTGEYSILFWSVIILGMIVPIVVMISKKGRKPLPMLIVAILIVVGAWFKRFLIVTPTLLNPFLPIQDVPDSYHHYFPTVLESLITLGSLAGVLLVMTGFTRLFPIIPIAEPIDYEERLNVKGKKSLVSKTVIATLFVLSLTLPSKAVDKSTAQMRLDYNKIDSSSYVTLQVRTRDGRKYLPAEGVIVNLFLNEESKQGMMGNVITDEEGKGIYILPGKFYNAYDTLTEWNFIARILGDSNLEDQRKYLKVKKAELQMDLIQEDSLHQVLVSLYEHTNGHLIPVPEIQIKIFVRRMFGLLPIDNGYAFTDDQGQVVVNYPNNIPADTSGNVSIVAKVIDHDDFGNITIEQNMKWGDAVNVEDILSKRTLWSTRSKAPFWLIVAANSVILGIWGVIIYLVYQLVRVNRIGKRQINIH